MISEKERDISKSEMLAFFQSVPDNNRALLGLMGGWAVNFLLEKRRVPHIGSRDIDIFFDSRQIAQKSVVELIENRGFSPQSMFRWVKFFEWDSEKQISEAESQRLDEHNLVRIYLDLASPVKLDHAFGEPLLSEVFNGYSEYWNSGSYSILMPSIRLMVKIKIKSTTGRIDTFKREKDLADLLAMVRNETRLWTMRNGNRISLGDDMRDNNLTILKEAIKQYQVDGTLSNACREISMDFNSALTTLQIL